MKHELAPVVKGKLVDEYTRCVHYHTPFDIIAIKFKCCNEYYPCFECHEEVAGHKSEVWKKNEFDKRAILCGICNSEMTVQEYLASDSRCPRCNSAFNPNCSKHYHLYFEI
jgi:uncharacterized CHY-type Zn-finger protein